MTFPYSRKTIKRFVEFIYYGRFKQEPTEAEFGEILRFVVKYEMVNFEQYLLDCMERIINESNACILLDVSHRAENTNAKKQCIQFFADRPDQFFNIPGVANLPQDLANELFDAIRRRQAAPKVEPSDQEQLCENSTNHDILVKAEPLDEDILLEVDELNEVGDTEYDEDELLNSPKDDHLAEDVTTETAMETEEGEIL